MLICLHDRHVILYSTKILPYEVSPPPGIYYRTFFRGLKVRGAGIDVDPQLRASQMC